MDVTISKLEQRRAARQLSPEGLAELIRARCQAGRSIYDLLPDVVQHNVTLRPTIDDMGLLNARHYESVSFEHLMPLDRRTPLTAHIAAFLLLMDNLGDYTLSSPRIPTREIVEAHLNPSQYTVYQGSDQFDLDLKHGDYTSSRVIFHGEARNFNRAMFLDSLFLNLTKPFLAMSSRRTDNRRHTCDLSVAFGEDDEMFDDCTGQNYHNLVIRALQPNHLAPQECAESLAIIDHEPFINHLDDQPNLGYRVLGITRDMHRLLSPP